MNLHFQLSSGTSCHIPLKMGLSFAFNSNSSLHIPWPHAPQELPEMPELSLAKEHSP